MPPPYDRDIHYIVKLPHMMKIQNRERLCGRSLLMYLHYSLP